MTRINTNIQSLVARRVLDRNNQSLSVALERLSTGLRINSGGDDPAGLIASETLRAGLRDITSAIDNANRADTIIAIAEGGLQEVSSLLLELEGLVSSTANEAGLTDDEVAANQLQIDSILASVNRIASSTVFGDKKLLDGTLDFMTSSVVNTNIGSLDIFSARIADGASRNVVVSVTQSAQTAELIFAGEQAGLPQGANVTSFTSATTVEITGAIGAELLSFASGTSLASVATAINAVAGITGVSAVVSTSVAGAFTSSLVLNSTTYGLDSFVTVRSITGNFVVGGNAGTSATDAGRDATVLVNGQNGTVDGLDVAVNSESLTLKMTLTAAFGGGGIANNPTTSFQVTGGGAVFAISPDVSLAGQATLGITSVTAANLGKSDVGFISSLGSGQVNDMTSKNFFTGQRVVREAIDQIASLRGRLGSFQRNTIQTTINALTIARENVTAAESAIRDADFAQETSNLTRAQILVNSSTLTLQLANSQPQNILALLG